MTAAPRACDRVQISVLVPLLDEAESLASLNERLLDVLETLGRPFEIIYCDDGSADGSFEVLAGLAAGDARVKAVRLRRNFGQTAALVAGLDHSSGAVVVPIDADLQNDPRDIPRLLDKLEEGFDVVKGWRRERRDRLLTVTLPSRIGNTVIGAVTGVRLHDQGCTLSAYRREILEELHLRGEMHRFIPTWAASVGARVTEIPVAHHPRRFGRSKYSLSKASRVLLDLLTICFVTRYATRPIHLLGKVALAFAGAGALTLGGALGAWLLGAEPLFAVALLVTGVVLSTAAIQTLALGLVAELLSRSRHGAPGARIFAVRETVNLDHSRSETELRSA